jgi:hypothetical protein
MGVGLFPLLEKEGWPRHQQKFPFRSEAAGVVSSAKVLRTHSETFRRTDHPGCAISVASRLFVNAQPPLLFKEGKSFMPTFLLLYSGISLELLVQDGQSPVPSLKRRGGCGINKKSQSLRSAADGVVSSAKLFRP